MKIHQRVREIRLSKGVTQKHLAKRLGIGASTYCSKEKGLRRFTIEEIGIIAVTLNVNHSIFFENVILETRSEKVANY